MLASLESGEGRGIRFVLEKGVMSFEADDGKGAQSWSCDSGLLEPGREHHVAVIVDGGPGIVSWVVDGVLCDGGDERVRSWQRFQERGKKTTLLGRAGRLGSGESLEQSDAVGELRLYVRALQTSEAISNHRSGR